MKVKNETEFGGTDLEIILPPWIAFPDVDPMDMFWRMGKGEDYLELFFQFYEKLSDKQSFQARFPAVEEWKEFYD